MAFSNRTDLPVLIQAALVHAQFESIHPFTDGNGRIGRALINTILRRRGVTQRVVVPLASALVAHKEAYFDVLNAYRAGDAGPIIESFSRASAIAAGESRTTAERLTALPGEWFERAGEPRRGSAARLLVDTLLENPIFTADQVAARLGIPASTCYAAIAKLEKAGVLRPLIDRARNQVWGASDLLDELDDLGTRIGAATRLARLTART